MRAAQPTRDNRSRAHSSHEALIRVACWACWLLEAKLKKNHFFNFSPWRGGGAAVVCAPLNLEAEGSLACCSPPGPPARSALRPAGPPQSADKSAPSSPAGRKGVGRLSEAVAVTVTVTFLSCRKRRRGDGGGKAGRVAAAEEKEKGGSFCRGRGGGRQVTLSGDGVSWWLADAPLLLPDALRLCQGGGGGARA